MDTHEYSVQSLLNMDIEENLYRRCIDDVKSPLQTFNLTRSTIDTGSKVFRTNQFSNLKEQPQIKVAEFQEHKSRIGLSRQRRKIFDGRVTVPQIKNISAQVSPGGCWLGCMNGFQPLSSRTNILEQIETARSEEIQIKKFQLFDNQHSEPKLQSLYYDDPSVPTYEAEFIQLLLKIVPKLYLRNQLSRHLCVNKAELLQSLMSQLYKQEKSRAINQLFLTGNLHRIDQRLNSTNLNQFINRLTLTSNIPVNSRAQQQVITTVQKTISILNQVEEDIRQYLLSDRRVQELRTIYQEMTSKHAYPKLLSLTLYQYLNGKGITCKEANIQCLEYVWPQLNRRAYTLEQFVSEITKNDIIVKQLSKDSWELQSELQKQGYTRNRN